MDDDRDPDRIEFPTLPPIPVPESGDYRTLVADPPWMYDDDSPWGGSGYHYGSLHEGTIAGMAPQIKSVTGSHGHLYMWSTSAFIDEALDIIEAWGFTYKSSLVWVKTQKPTGESRPYLGDRVEVDPQMGTGSYHRNAHELLLFAVKNNVGTNRNDVRSVFYAPRGDQHSGKPERAYELIGQQSDGPYLDLFSRREADGWESWGKSTEAPR